MQDFIIPLGTYFAPVLMTVMTSSLLLFVAALFLRHTGLLLKVGYGFLIWLTALIALRMLLTVEFPFTKALVLPKAISMPLSKFLHPFFAFGWLDISLWTIFRFVWLAGILIGGLKEWCKIRLLRNQVNSFGTDLTEEEPYRSMLRCIGENIPACLRIVSWKGVRVPCVFGLGRPYILLPESLDVNGEELEVILEHELAHVRHHDLLMKYLIKAVTLIYWWNPVVHFLNRQMDAALDMRIDEQLTREDPEKKRQYLSCLIRVAESAAFSGQESSPPLGISMCSDVSLIRRRFELMLHPRRYGMVISVAFLITAGIFVTSYLFKLEAVGYTSPEIDEAYFILTDDNAYVIKNSQGTYDVYWEGMYIETVETLRLYPDITKIYNEKGELIK